MNQNIALTYDENGGFAQILERSARLFSRKTAIISKSQKVSYWELDNRAGRLAACLESLKLSENRKVAILMPNCQEFLEIVFACAKAGIPVAKINWRLSPREIIKLLKVNDVGLVFLRMKNITWKQDVLDELSDIAYIDMDTSTYYDLLAGQPEIISHRTIPKDQELMLIHTSGTSGTPKSVVYTHGNFLEQVSLCVRTMNFTSNIVFQMMAQLFHTVSIGAYMCMAVGGTLVLFDHFDPDAYMESIQKNKVTRISAIPTVVQMLMDHPDFDKYDLSSLKALSYSTSPMPPALLGQLMSKLRCDYYQTYGMTEMGSIVTVLGKDDHVRGSSRIYSVGQPMPGCAVKIVGDDGRICSVGDVGEIALKGPGLMKGYYKMPETTAMVVRDGWYYTNDMGYLDESGYLFLCGRKSEMIISGGENVYPNEVEDVIREMESDIGDCAVFGIPHAKWGEIVCACVVLRPGSTIGVEDIKAFCANKLAKYKIPKQIHIMDLLPRSITGKVVKKQLLEQCMGFTSHDSTS